MSNRRFVCKREADDEISNDHKRIKSVNFDEYDIGQKDDVTRQSTGKFCLSACPLTISLP